MPSRKAARSHFSAFQSTFSQSMRKQRIQCVIFDFEETFELFNPMTRSWRREWLAITHRRNHQVFRRMFGGYEFDRLRAIARPFQKETAQSVRRPFGQALGHDAVCKDGRERSRATKLRSQFLGTARGNDYQLRGQLDTAANGIIRRGVASVQGDEGIDVWKCGAFDGSRRERQPIRTNFARERICRAYQSLPHLPPDYARGLLPHPGEQVPQSKSQISLAATHVGDDQLAIGR